MLKLASVDEIEAKLNSQDKSTLKEKAEKFVDRITLTDDENFKSIKKFIK